MIPTSSAIAQSATPEDTYGDQYKPESVSVITQTGQILYQSNDDKVTDPASLTKMMTMYLTFDAIENGDIKASDKIQITPDYEKMSELPNLASVPLEAEQAYTIDQFLRQITLESSNAATLILGEKIAGSTSRFTNQMNDKAKKIGMEHTHFVNPTGADNQLLHQYAPEKYKKEPVSYTHLTLPTNTVTCRSRWSPYH